MSTPPPTDLTHCLAGSGSNSLTESVKCHGSCLSSGMTLTDEELGLLRKIAVAEEPVIFQAEARTVPAHITFDHRVDVLRDLRTAGWIVLEVWIAEPGNRGHARRRYSAAQATARSQAGRPSI